MPNYQYDIDTKCLLESFEFDDFTEEDAQEFENEFFQADTTSSEQDRYQELIDSGYYDDVIAIYEKEIIQRIFCDDYFQTYMFDKDNWTSPKKQILLNQCKSDKSKFIVHYVIIQENANSSVNVGISFPMFIINGDPKNIDIIESFDYTSTQPNAVYDIKYCGTLYNLSFAYIVSLQTICVANEAADLGFNTGIAFYSYRNSNDTMVSKNLFVNPEYDDSIYNDQSFNPKNIDLFLNAIQSKENWFEAFGKHQHRIVELFVNCKLYCHPNCFATQFIILDKNEPAINIEFEKSEVYSENACVIPSITKFTKKFCRKHNINFDEYCGEAMIAKTYTLMQHGLDPHSN